MSQTKAQRRKQQKKTAKAKANRKRRNVEHNQAPVKWRLDVYHKDRWVTDFRRFRKWEQVQRHLDETEEARKKERQDAQFATRLRDDLLHIIGGAASCAHPNNIDALFAGIAAKPSDEVTVANLKRAARELLTIADAMKGNNNDQPS